MKQFFTMTPRMERICHAYQYPKRGQPLIWKEEEVETIKRLFAQGKSTLEISKIFNTVFSKPKISSKNIQYVLHRNNIRRIAASKPKMIG